MAGAAVKCSIAMATVAVVLSVPAAAQEFQPPRAAAAGEGTRFGLYGFGMHAGLDLTGPSRLVLGATLDLGNLFSDRLRLRASGEVGIDGQNSYVGSGELLHRFAGDAEPTVPYLGGGVSVAGHDDCGSDRDCPDLWVNLVFGFERRFRSTFNWMLEYHAMDRLRRHRIYLGLTTRRGG
jgi:hypothetical protein